MTPTGAIAPAAPVETAARTLIVACGALARELKAVLRASRFVGIDVVCLPASLHNRPERIAPAVAAVLAERGAAYDRVLCLYGDCGTAGALDRVLTEAGAERVPGAHCYAFLAGVDVFDRVMDEEPGTFFLTDYLVRHFERLVIRGLGLDRFPELLPSYFGHYRRVVHLVQMPDPDLAQLARDAAAQLGLCCETRQTGVGALSRFIAIRAAESVLS